jgi:two-component system, NarL family, nitrate/nitrite response regulator NarL
MADTESGPPIRVIVLIENRIMRDALVRFFHKRTDLAVVGQTSQADETALATLDAHGNVLIGDAFLADRLRADPLTEGGMLAKCRIILIGMSPDKEQFLAAVRFGVTGYLLQDASATDIISAVRAVSRGEAVCPPQLCFELFRVARQSAEIGFSDLTLRPDLTLRQQQLIKLVAKGLTNKEIASHLNLSEFTVRNHIHRILKQVDAASRSEAVQTIRSYGYEVSS